jgi:hypothetical protein
MNIQQAAVVYCWHDIDHPIQDDDVSSVANQQKQVQHYLEQHPQLSVIGTYTEQRDKRQKKFNELEKALINAKNQNAVLIIARLENLTRFEGFTDALMAANIEFTCLDQLTVTRETLPAVVEYVRQLRLLHSARIRRGLEETITKLGKRLGNPNALKEITKVNKPKTESAIMFALVLAPIIATYRRKGFSQRKMVDCLNHEGFTAPEGGHWVLSQLQKVLERIDLNNIALNAAETLEEFKQLGYNDEQIIQGLNNIHVRSPGGGPWTVQKLETARERLDLIKEIGDFNQFIADVYPQIFELGRLGRTAEEIASAFNQKGIKVPDRVLWELSQEDEEPHEYESEQWDAHTIEIVEHIIDRRRKDMDTFLNPKTVAASQQILDKASGSTTTTQS